MTHKVAQGSFNNKIELTVENSSSFVTRRVNVEVKSPPSWVNFEKETVIIDEIQANSDGIASFIFSVDESVPVRTEYILRFVIRSERGEKWTKEIAIEIVKSSFLRRLMNKLNEWAVRQTAARRII